jgi:Xaa-Pro aminopeptidase
MLPAHLRTACEERRSRLLASLGTGAAVLYAGRSRPRNYVANPFPFRASSHFLYFVGAGIEGALLWFESGVATLFLTEPDEDDALWHGAQPSLAQLSADLGLPVASLATFEARVRGKKPALIAPVDNADRVWLCAQLGRDPNASNDADAALIEAVVGLRLVHDHAAQTELRRAADVSVRAHLAGMRNTRVGDHERDVCAAMEAVFARAGFGTAYNSIVTVHGEVLHNHAHHHPLHAGDLLLADVGGETDTGYAADITRTWPVNGVFSPTQRDIYDLVLEAQRAAIEQVRPGVRYRDVHLAAARAINRGLVALGIFHGDADALTEDGAHALFFPHGIGHLLGLDVHDMEDVGDVAGYAQGRVRSKQFGLAYLRLDRDLAPGMLVTIEPGFYQVPSLLQNPQRVGLSIKALRRDRLAAFQDVRGIRIEDDVLVTKDGSDVLTQALPKAAREIEALVAEGQC